MFQEKKKMLEDKMEMPEKKSTMFELSIKNI
jgi:hypothetical protein